MRNKRQTKREPLINPFKHDPIEDDPVMQLHLKMADEEAHAEITAQGQNRGFGYGFIFSRVKKRILKEKYQIEWQTPDEMNPTWDFD